MSKIYIAKRLVGRFNSGDEVTGLTDARAEYLLAKGAIEAVEGKSTAKADDAPKTATKGKTTAKKSTDEAE